jgi:hypothetical protein
MVHLMFFLLSAAFPGNCVRVSRPLPDTPALHSEIPAEIALPPFILASGNR